MHIQSFLHEMLSPVMHLKRLKTLNELVLSGLKNKKVSITELGRGLEGKASERSQIRKSDRFIGNIKLTRERVLVYRKVTNLLIGSKKRPWIIVDWSHIPNTKNYLLRAALATSGRAVTLYEEVHPQTLENNPKVHREFLETLKTCLPEDCRPIIITDAGFSNPWFRQVLSLNWDYVGRVRGRKCFRIKGKATWRAYSSFKKQGTPKGAYLGEIELCKTDSLMTRGYVIKQKKKGRVSVNKEGKKSQHKKDKEHSKAANEPWLLVSSLEECYHTTKKVFKIYKTRMQIEESFRDLKSSKYGLSFEKAYSKSCDRIAALLLIAMLACLAAWLTGAFAEKRNWHYSFQANSTKNKRVLSLFFLGCRVIKRGLDIPFELFKELIFSNELPLCAL